VEYHHGPAISQNTGQTYGRLRSFAPWTYGAEYGGRPDHLQQQDAGSGVLTGNYCRTADDMKSAIAAASANWDHNSPKVILIQAQPWNDVKPTDFLNVANSLSSDYS